MATNFEDPVARQMIADHIRHCDKNAAILHDALATIARGQDNLWKAITRGRETRFRMLIGVVSFLIITLAGLIGYIWQSSPAGAADRVAVCYNPAQSAAAYLSVIHNQYPIWSGLSINDSTIKLYQAENGDWTVTVQQADRPECEYSWGSLGLKMPSPRPVLDS